MLLSIRLVILVFVSLSISHSSIAQTSWTGQSSTSWKTAGNWTNGVPDATKDAIIGDGSWLGVNLPTLPPGAGSGVCKNLTLTGGVVTLLISDDLTVNGNVTIGSGTTINHNNSNFTLTGNWINNGTYNTLNANRKVYFSGTSQTISGTTVTDFEKVYVNTGSTVTLATNVSVSNFLNVSGTFDPTENFTVTGGGDVNVSTNGVVKVKATTLAGNYPAVTINLSTTTSTVDYASAINNQTVSNAITYRKLIISGGTIKTLAGNISVANDVAINMGTLDLGSSTANRTGSGGTFTMASGTTLRIGGAATTFPSNYTTRTLAPTSTVEYYGGAQTVTALTYGNLILSIPSGTVTKSMPATAFTVAGDFTASAGAGTLSFTAGNAITILGSVSLSLSSTFNGGSFSHTVGGNWTNAGAFSGCAGTVTFTGAGASMSGAGSNQFGNVAVSGNGFTVNAATSLSVCGNFSTSNGGSFLHNTGGAGVFSLVSASAKTINGSNIIFDDVSITGGSVSSTSSFTIAGDLTADGTLTATAGTITWSGAGKTFGGASAVQVAGLIITGSYTAARDLSISANFSVSGSYTAVSNLTTFNGNSTFSGIASLFNIQIANSSTLIMGGNSTLRIAGTQVLGAGATLNTSSNIPNTFVFNSTTAQTIVYTSFNNLVVQGGDTKTPAAGLAIGGNFTIAASTTFDANTFSHSLAGNFNNSGTFTAGTSTVTLNGTLDASITGITTFNILTLSKGVANIVTLNSDVTVATLNMTSGNMLTGASSVTITTTRTGPGIILGTITRTHAFNTTPNYEFESPNNFIKFTAATGVTSITVVVNDAAVTNFPSGVAINRKYTITITATSYTANLRLHYEQPELNGNSENAMTIWSDQGINVWTNLTKSSNDAGNNWVELDGLSSIADSYTMSDGQSILSWDGSASSAWEDPANWTASGGAPGPVPTLNETVNIGDLAFVNQPVISSTAQAKGITFYSTTQSTLRISSGSLTVQGNIQGSWSGNAAHTVDIGSRTITTFSDIILSDGTTGHTIDITGTSGNVNINGSLTQGGGANITFSGAGNLSISNNYNYTSGNYTSGASGTVTYNGTSDQAVANVTYQNLVIDKAFGLATTSSPLTINGNLQVITSGGALIANGALTVGGNVEVSTGTVLNTPSSNITVAGDWLVTGTFNPGSGTVTFNGTGAQSMTASTFNNLTVNKPAASVLTLTGNINLNGNISIASGTVDVNTRDVTRTTTGGSATLGANAMARFSGTGLQIINFSSLVANPTSTIEYYGTSARPIPPITFGNLILSNGGSNAKTMVAATIVLGNLTINAGATLVLPSSTLNVAGNIVATGTFNATPGTLILDGASKTIANTGAVTYNNVVVNGSYTVTSGDLNFNGHLQINGSLDLGSATVNSSGDLTNSGALFSSGNVTFLGTQVQTIRLLNAVSSTSTGVINFNGTISPVLNSNSSPTFATVNINNSSPITASESWTVLVGMNIASGSTWNAGPFTHNIAGNFANNGTTVSSGTIRFVPTSSVNVNLGSGFNSTGKVVFGGTGAINLTGTTSAFASVDFTNTNGSGITIPTGWSLSHNLLIGPGTTVNAGTFSHTVAGTWTNNGTFNGNTSTVTFTSTTTTDEIVGTGTSNFNHIVFAPSSTITVVADVNVAGDWTNNATSVLLQYGRVRFQGTATSNVGGTTLTDFHDVEVNKTSGGVQLLRDISINSSLTLTAGPFLLNEHRLTVSNPLNTAVTSTSTGYVVSESTTFAGIFDWVIGTDNTLHEFPYGTATGTLIPMQFTATSGDAGTVSTSTYPTAANNDPLPPGVGHVSDFAGFDNSANTVDRFFYVNTTGGSSPVATVTFTATPAEVGTITDLVGQRWNGANWDAPLNGQSATATSVTVPGITQFSPWAISGNFHSLPIELVSLNAVLAGNKVIIQWETASELNNDSFEVEKSHDGKDFFAIGQVPGSGTSKETHTYQLKDYEISKGRWFYRIKQIDYDKRSTLSGVVAVNIGDIDPIDFQLAPNPVIEKLSISSNSTFIDDMSITIFDAAGKVAYNKEHPGFGHDDTLNIDTNSIAPGVYVVNIKYGGFTKSYRVVKRQ